VRLETLTQAVNVPHEAVNVGQSGSFVFVISDDNKAEMRPVSVVYEDPTVAVLGSGVKAGERVVIDGQLRLSPGAPVSVLGSTPERPSAEEPANRNVQTSASPQTTPPPATAQRGGEGPAARGG
jgi:membrane fusion protein, multidrug efflux system